LFSVRNVLRYYASAYQFSASLRKKIALASQKRISPYSKDFASMSSQRTAGTELSQPPYSVNPDFWLAAINV